MKLADYISDTVNASWKIARMFYRKNKALIVMDIVLGFSKECRTLIGISFLFCCLFQH